MKKRTGIWLDYRQAELMSYEDLDAAPAIVLSNVEEVNVGGGSRSNVPYGPMDKHSDTKLLARRKNQLNIFFKEIANRINKVDEILIFGPGEIKSMFSNYLKSLNNFQPYVHPEKTTDQMTLNQKNAFVRKFFGTNG